MREHNYYELYKTYLKFRMIFGSASSETTEAWSSFMEDFMTFLKSSFRNAKSISYSKPTDTSIEVKVEMPEGAIYLKLDVTGLQYQK